MASGVLFMLSYFSNVRSMATGGLIPQSLLVKYRNTVEARHSQRKGR